MKLDELDILKIGHEIQLVGALYAGEGKLFMCQFPGEHDPRQVLDRLDMDHEEWKRFLEQSDVLAVQALTMGENGKLVKAVLRKSQRTIEQNVSWAVFRRDGYACRYCGRADVPLTVDHLVLWEEGGPSTEANLVSACKKCNRVRGNLAYADWLKHPHYLRVSTVLDPVTRAANEALLARLDAIPRKAHQRSR